MEYPNEYYEANNYYPETPNTRKRPYEYIPEDPSKRNTTQYYQNGYQNYYYDHNGYYNSNTSDNRYESLNTSNQMTMDNSWYSAPTQFHDYSQRRTPPINTNQPITNDYTNMQTPVTYANGNNSVSNSLIYTPESDTSSSQSEYFGAPMTAAQYHQHMQNLEMKKRRVQVNPVIPQVQAGLQSVDAIHPNAVPPPHPAKEILKKLPIEDLKMILDNRKFDEEIQKPQSYYHKTSPDDGIVLDMVDGRLPIVQDSSKFELTAEELRRRVAAPECINKSSLFSFFRISKRKDGSKDITNLLNKCNLTVKPGQRQLSETKFTFLLEKEALRLAQSFDFMYRETCPVELLAWNLLEECTSDGSSLESCHSTAQQAAAILARMLSLYRDTQPKVAGVPERYRKTKFDEKFAKISLLTHGFLHPHSITNFLTLQKVFEKTAELSERIRKGEIEMREIEELEDDEKPFEVMSDFLFEYWKKENASSETFMSEDELQCERNTDLSLTSSSNITEEDVTTLDDEFLEDFDDDCRGKYDEPLLKCIALLTVDDPEFKKSNPQLYSLFKGCEVVKTDEDKIGISNDKENNCDKAEVLDNDCLVEKEDDVAECGDNQSVTLPQKSDVDFLSIVQNMDFDEEEEYEDVDSLLGEDCSIRDEINDELVFYGFAIAWTLDLDIESEFHGNDDSDDEASDNETPDNTTFHKKSDDETSDDEPSGGENGKTYADNHTAEIPSDALSSHVEVQEEVGASQPFKEQWNLFVAPSVDQLREMSHEDLAMLPVPDGETSEYWHDKALMAHFEQF